MYREIRKRVDLLELPFNAYGVDPFGVSRESLAFVLTLLAWIYRSYLSMTVEGIHHVPKRGRAMIVGNHSGGIALDGAMVMASLFLEMTPPRLAHAMVDTSVGRMPFLGNWFLRVGQLAGLPEHARRLLENDRLLMVFPEGAKGTAKLWWERYSLVRFGTGFVRLALQTKSPIVPFAFLGGGEAIPTIMNLERIGNLLGVPYFPVTPYLLPVPRPVPCKVLYGAPMYFEGNGKEADHVIQQYVDVVRDRVAQLIEQGREGFVEAPPPKVVVNLSRERSQESPESKS